MMDRDITKQKWENVCLLAVFNRCICPYIPDVLHMNMQKENLIKSMQVKLSEMYFFNCLNCLFSALSFL